MDYWEYLAHSQDGSTRSGHRYYARELVGNKGGKNVYRYFYTAAEYDSYRRSGSNHASAAKTEKPTLLERARKSHSENRWRPDTMISTANTASVTYKNSAGKKRHTDLAGAPAVKKAEREWKRKTNKSYEKNRDRLEAVYQADKHLRRAKRKVQKAGMDIKRNVKNGAAAVSKLIGHKTTISRPKKKGTSSKTSAKSSSGSSTHSTTS